MNTRRHRQRNNAKRPVDGVFQEMFFRRVAEGNRVKHRATASGDSAKCKPPLGGPRRRSRLVAAIVVGCYLIDLLVPALLLGSINGWKVAIGFGVLAAQVSLVVVWTALSNDNFAMRVPRSLFLVSGIVLSLTLGGLGSPDFTLAQLSWLVAPAALAAHLIMEALRRFAGWRLVAAGDVAGSDVRQFTLRQMLVQVVLLAIVLGAGRALGQESGVQMRDWLNLSWESLTMAYVVVVSLPLVWFVFRLPPHEAVAGCFAWLMALLALEGMFVVLVSLDAEMPGMIITVAAAIQSTQFVLMGAGLGGLRAAGCRLAAGSLPVKGSRER